MFMVYEQLTPRYRSTEVGPGYSRSESSPILCQFPRTPPKIEKKIGP